MSFSNVTVEQLFSLWQSGSSLATLSTTYGLSQSCGCLQRELVSQRTIIDLKGKRFGKLLVNARVGSDNYGQSLWACICQCGQQITVRGRSLSNGDTSSCGC